MPFRGTSKWVRVWPRTRPNPCWYGDDGIWAWGPVKIDAYITITFSKLSAQSWLTDNASFAREPTSGREQKRHNSQGLGIGTTTSRCTCMLTMLNSETLVLHVLRLVTVRLFNVVRVLNQLFVTVNFAHSVTLKAELRRSIEVVSAGNHSVAELSTGFEKVTDLSTASFCRWRPEWWHTGIVFVFFFFFLNSGSLAPSLCPSPHDYRINAPFFLVKKKKKKKKKDRGRIFQQRKRQIYARSGINLLACILSHPSRSERRSFHSAKGIYVCKARVVIQQITDRRDVFFSLHVTPPLWGGGAPSLRWGNFPSWRDFPFEWTNQSVFIFTGHQAQIPSSPYQQGLGLVRG